MSLEKWREHWEEKRIISKDIVLDCNFEMGNTFPAIIRQLGKGNILLTENELYKLMEEIADRFDKDIVDKATGEKS